MSHIRLIMDFCSNVWSVGYLGDIRLLEMCNEGGLERLPISVILLMWRDRRGWSFSVIGRGLILLNVGRYFILWWAVVYWMGLLWLLIEESVDTHLRLWFIGVNWR